MKKTVLLIAIVAILFAPFLTILAEDSNDPGKTEQIPTDTTPAPPAAPGESTDIFGAFTKTFSAIGNAIPIVLIAIDIMIAVWVYFDASRRTRYGWLCGIASLLVVPWIIYVLWRPIYTLEERKMLETEEELRKIQHDYYMYVLSKEKHICSVCGTPLQADYKLCPNCYSEVKKTCPKCGKAIELDWKVCPYCGNR